MLPPSLYTYYKVCNLEKGMLELSQILNRFESQSPRAKNGPYSPPILRPDARI